MPKYSRARKEISAAEQQVGQAEVVTMKTTGPAKLERSVIEIPEGPVTKSFADALKEGEEILTVVVHTTTDKHAEPAPYFWNNGKRYIFPRGFEVKVPRKVVEQLARCKETGFKNEEFTDNDGSRAVRWPAQTGLRYPFSVTHDPNPRLGDAWLKKILAEKQ